MTQVYLVPIEALQLCHHGDSMKWLKDAEDPWGHPVLVSRSCNLCSHLEPCTWKDPTLGLTLCCHHFDITNNFYILILHWVLKSGS